MGMSRYLRELALRRACSALVLGALLALLAAVPSSAALLTWGSSLSVPATLNTTEDLGYQGVDTPVFPSPQFPNGGSFHTYHYGADTALWNALAFNPGSATIGPAGSPVAGQAVKVSVEGCAEPAAGGPPPLTEIHIQDLSPIAGGGARVNLTSQPYEMPVCGQNGAGRTTVTSFEPYNLCVNRGDFVAFNDEGGWVPFVYQSGVPFDVIGKVPGSTMDSFIRGNGTKNGAILSASDTTAMDGFEALSGEELMMQVTLGTGPDARYVCPGGTKEAPPVLPPVSVRPQTDGVNAHRIVSFAIYCRLKAGCHGTATLTLGGARSSFAHLSLALPGNRTSHVPFRVTNAIMRLIRKHHGVSVQLSAVVGGQTFSQTISVKIL
jgi:hypothetical protein